MVFPILGANTESAAYEIDNSLRFNDGDNPKLAFTPSSAVVAERKTFTISCWVKRGIISTTQYLWEMGGNDNANDRFFARFDVSNKLKISDSGTIYRETNRLFRDPSAWYHIVVAVDTTDSTAGNRVKVYVNGVQETSFATSNNPGLNDQKGFSDDSEHTIGRTGIDNGFSLDGYIADFNAVGGSQLAPTSFGETNDNGVWIPKNYTGSHGTNGFKLEFKQTGTSQNSSGIGADTSGNDNHFAVTNLAATDVTTDTPTNNFCTWNPLIGRAAAYATFAEGNLDADFTSGSVYWRATGSIGVTSGKWYAEIKCIDDGGNNDLKIGVEHASPDQTTIDGVHKVIQSWNGYKASGGSASSYGDTYTNGDIVGVLLDMDNGTIKFSKNGTLMASGASAYTDLISAMPDSGWAFFAYGYDNANVQANFGNAPFSISSGNSDANGYGNFEYAVPSGYYALCTKNLAEFG